MKLRTKIFATPPLITLLLMALCALCGTAFAQGTGTILGVVRDQTGAVVLGATVQIKNTKTGVGRTVTSDANGYYAVNLLPVGEYEMEVRARGFSTVVRTGVHLLLAQIADVDFELKVSAVEEKVVVNQDAPLVDVESASLGNVEISSRIEELPLNKRDFYQLAVLQPGVLPPYTGREARPLAEALPVGKSHACSVAVLQCAKRSRHCPVTLTRHPRGGHPG